MSAGYWTAHSDRDFEDANAREPVENEDVEPLSMFDDAQASRSLEHHDAWVSLITQAEDALQAMWNHFGDLSDNDMLGMPCKGALVKCRLALATIKKAKEGR